MRPLDTLISVTGRPYDTLNSVIGSEKSADTGSLADFAVKYEQVEFGDNGDIDYENVELPETGSLKFDFEVAVKSHLSPLVSWCFHTRPVCSIHYYGYTP